MFNNMYLLYKPQVQVQVDSSTSTSRFIKWNNNTHPVISAIVKDGKLQKTTTNKQTK